MIFGPREKSDLTVDEEIQILEAYQDQLGLLDNEEDALVFDTED